MGFASFSEFEVEMNPKDSLLDRFKQMPSFKNWTHDDSHKTYYI